MAGCCRAAERSPGARDACRDAHVAWLAVLIGLRGRDRMVLVCAGDRQAVALQERDEVLEHLPGSDAVVGEDVVAVVFCA